MTKLSVFVTVQVECSIEVQDEAIEEGGIVLQSAINEVHAAARDAYAILWRAVEDYEGDKVKGLGIESVSLEAWHSRLDGAPDADCEPVYEADMP